MGHRRRAFTADDRLAAVALSVRVGTRAAARLIRVSPQSIVTWRHKYGALRVVARRPCRVCGAATPNKAFCSRTCRATHDHTVVMCCRCGCPAMVPKSVGTGPRARKFCSQACYHESRRVSAAVPVKRRGASWKPARKACVDRYEGRCALCRLPGNHVHHIIPFKHFNGDHMSANRQDNLALLCGPCHVTVERWVRQTLRRYGAVDVGVLRVVRAIGGANE